VNVVLDLFRRIIGLPAGASTISDDIDALHLFVIGSTFAVAAYVFAMTAWFIARHRRRKRNALTQRVAARPLHEMALIGGVTFVFLFWWVLGFRQYVKIHEPPGDADIVYVEAKQWMWKFVDRDGRSTNDTLTVQAGRPVRLVMTSRDVIHSFFVPSFRLKQDVVPGRTTTLWFQAKDPGIYPIWCAEYCGLNHSNMRGEIVVLSAEDYARYRDGAPGEPGGLVAQGREVAMKRGCVACHTLDGQRHVGPTFRGLFGSDVALADGRHVLADEAYLTRSMVEPNADVVAGFPQVMPSYQGSLSPAEAGALVELIKSVKNETGQSLGVALPRLQVAPAAPDRGSR
jgi:cytochrome c oxidase subunit 2